MQETEDRVACVGRKECHLSSIATEEKAESKGTEQVGGRMSSDSLWRLLAACFRLLGNRKPSCHRKAEDGDRVRILRIEEVE